MTRVIGGIYDDAVVDNGFFMSDKDVDIVIGWLDSYANALEKQWVSRGSEGDPKAQKFSKVRSFKAAINKSRNS